MHVRKITNGYLVRFDRGEEILAGLERFARENDVRGAEVRAIGSITDPELGYYDLAHKVYEWRVVNGNFEILSLLGNVTWFQDGPIAHLHATIGARDLSVQGGHLKSGKAGATCECVIRTFDEAIDRSFDADTGLNLWALEQ